MKKCMLIIFIVVIAFGMISCGSKEDSGSKGEVSYTLKITEKIIETDRYDYTHYYFVVESFGMVSVGFRDYNTYMIGDMYTFTVRTWNYSIIQKNDNHN